MKGTKIWVIGIVILIVSLLIPAFSSLAAEPPYKGITINIGTPACGSRGPISGALYYWRDKWEKMTGAKLNIIEVPIALIREKIFTDLFTGAGAYDGFDGPIWITGDFIAGDFIYDIEKWMGDPRFPYWDPKSVVPTALFVNQWKGKWYLAPNDYDTHTLNYRKDILTDLKWQKAFKEEKGYAFSVPPRTWEELADVAEFFNGKDWNGDGEPDTGYAQALAKGQQAGWLFMSLAAPYVMLPGNNGRPDRSHNILWFDPEDMEPLINEPGFVRALEMCIRLYKAGDPAQAGWEFGGCWGAFLAEKTIFNYGYQDLGPLVQDEDKSKVKGKLGCSVLPGTMEVWDRANQRWVNLGKPNILTNAMGPSWSIFVFKSSKHPEVVYHLAAFHASEEISFWNITHGFTGINMGRTFEFFKDQGGIATINDWVAQGWNAGDVEEYVKASYENYFLGETIVPQLRIPGMQAYYDALDDHLSEAVTGQLSPQEALDRCAQDWQMVTTQLGRKRQLKYYQDAIGYVK